MKTKKTQCMSTHGGAGYAPGSYIKDGQVVCGLCKAVISYQEHSGKWLTKNKKGNNE